jgi:hypothetical protein
MSKAALPTTLGQSKPAQSCRFARGPILIRIIFSCLEAEHCHALGVSHSGEDNAVEVGFSSKRIVPARVDSAIRRGKGQDFVMLDWVPLVIGVDLLPPCLGFRRYDTGWQSLSPQQSTPVGERSPVYHSCAPASEGAAVTTSIVVRTGRRMPASRGLVASETRSSPLPFAGLRGAERASIHKGGRCPITNPYLTPARRPLIAGGSAAATIRTSPALTSGGGP